MVTSMTIATTRTGMIGQSARRKGVDCRFARFQEGPNAEQGGRSENCQNDRAGEADHAHKKKERAKRAEPRKKNCRETISSLEGSRNEPGKRLPTPKAATISRMFAKMLGRVSSWSGDTNSGGSAQRASRVRESRKIRPESKHSKAQTNQEGRLRQAQELSNYWLFTSSIPIPQAKPKNDSEKR